MHNIGLYPIVDSPEWLEKLLPLGVSTIQLRIKNQLPAVIERCIIDSINIARRFEARLFINDYWQLAIQHGAYGVHLGQEDLHQTSKEALTTSGLQLGISTHNDTEIERALAWNPNYIAYGPIYPTQTKVMPFTPRGLLRLAYWVENLDCPIVAIGGINLARLPDVLATGVDGVAMISAITQVADPVVMTERLLAVFHE